MAEPALKTVLTFDDVRQLSPDDFPGELELGEWIPVPRPTPRHGQIVMRLGHTLAGYLEGHPIGDVAVGDPGVELAHDPDTLRGPDLVFLTNERLVDGRMPDEWLESAPDLAVEVVSKSQTLDETAQRARDYLAAGARMAWVVDPKARLVAVFIPPGDVRLMHEDKELDGGSVLPGFHCRVERLFR